jgi:hypothetical protein
VQNEVSFHFNVFLLQSDNWALLFTKAGAFETRITIHMHLYFKQAHYVTCDKMYVQFKLFLHNATFGAIYFNRIAAQLGILCQYVCECAILYTHCYLHDKG